MIVDYINSHQAEFWMVLGFCLLIIEVVTGLTTGILLFGGLGALVTGLLIFVGVLPETWLAGVASVGLASGLVTLLLWRPLKKFQGGREVGKDNSSDLIGYEFVVEQIIEALTPGRTRYSGIQWRVELDQHAGVESIQPGQRVVVTSVDAGIFRVKPVA